jgi:hypothetical protein
VTSTNAINSLGSLGPPPDGPIIQMFLLQATQCGRQRRRGPQSARSRQSRPSQGRQGHPLWQNVSKRPVEDLAYTMELAEGLEPKSGPNPEVFSQDTAVSKGGYLFACPSPSQDAVTVYRGAPAPFPLQQVVPQTPHIMAQPVSRSCQHAETLGVGHGGGLRRGEAVGRLHKHRSISEQHSYSQFFLHCM